MPKKRKSKPARTLNIHTDKPRASHGMYLRIVVTNNGGMYLPLTLGSFRDLTRAGDKVARAVRDYLRGIELVKHPRPYVLTVIPEWVETAAPPAREGGAGKREDVDNG